MHVTQDVVVDDLLVEAHKKAAKLARAHPPIASVVTDLVAATTRRRGDAVPRAWCARCTATSTSPSSSRRREDPCSSTSTRWCRDPPRSTWPSSSWSSRCGNFPQSVTQEVAHGLLSSYSGASGTEIDAALLETCADAEFLNRCYRHLRRHSPGWQSALETDLGRHAEMTALLRA